jgi:diguanylate cyclase (GGDEF)-like protein
MLTREVGRAAREGYPISLVMLDIDGFKRINDVYGHATGDLVLRVLGQQLLSQTRAGDIACRYGGDEFLLVLTNTDLGAATERAEQWRSSFEESSTSVMGFGESVSVSVGVATYPVHGESVEQVFAAADGAMYSAKAAGRNRVTVSPV